MANRTVRISVRDSDGEVSTWQFYLDSTVSTPETPIQDIVEKADLLIDGVVIDVSMTESMDKSGWTLKTSESAPNDRLVGGRFILITPEGYKTSFTLPTFDKATYVPANSENIDQAHADVSSFLAAVLGTTTNTAQGVEVTATDQAYEVHGGKR